MKTYKAFSLFFALALMISCTFTLSATAALEKGKAQVSQSQAGPGSMIQEGEAVKININAATVEDLQKLKGIGPRTAEEIVNYREANGPFYKAEDLMQVKGVGPKKYESISHLVVTE